MTHAQVWGDLYEGSHQKGSLGSVRANAGGDGHARHRQFYILFAVTHPCRHCEEPPDRANARPMTGSATKQLTRHSGMVR